MWSTIALALAGEPQVAIGDDGLLHASITIEASEEAVLAVLADAPRMASWTPEVLAYEPEGEPAGGCQVYAVKTKGLWSPLTYRSKRCRTTTGFRDTLVESDTFKTLATEWTVRAHDDGTTSIAFVGDLELSLPVPKKMLSNTRIKGMRHTLERLDAAARE